MGEVNGHCVATSRYSVLDLIALWLNAISNIAVWTQHIGAVIRNRSGFESLRFAQ